jgi:excinuclease ABC subunit C
MDDKAVYVGPFYGKTVVERAIRALRRIFPYYVKPYDGKKTLDTDLGLTPGIEIGKTTPEQYKKNLKKFIRYLEGDRKKLLRELEKSMKEEAAKGNYELAAEARDQLFGLKELQKKIVFSDKEFLDISSDQALMDLKRMLELKEPPRRIEGYDISHHSGTNTVGSMVVFINGASARSEYRKFKIRSSTNDDLKSMVEVITRRLKHKEWDYPDLIILDGGAGQVNAILPLVEPLNIPVIGRDKSGDHSKTATVKIIIPEKGLVPIDKGSHVARLIARIDEESHRFAITYHSLLKRKNMLK